MKVKWKSVLKNVSNHSLGGFSFLVFTVCLLVLVNGLQIKIESATMI